ncbi:MAG: hypothetical protein IIT39_13970 [Clostridia bacterium]|nr:hypothetical protein [Clostridia bacterium]
MSEKKFVIISLILLIGIEMTLRNIKINKIPDNIEPVNNVVFQSEKYPGEDMHGIEYNGRLYAFYGFESRTLLSLEIGKCFAVKDDSTYFYTLNATDDYICNIYKSSAIHVSDFYRAVDTQDKKNQNTL